MSQAIINLNPGDFVHGKALNHQYQTILGSCVSCILWHPASHFFAMCHYVLPYAGHVSNTSGADKKHINKTGHYGDLILPYFHRLVVKADIPVTEIQTQLYGGAGSQAAQRLSAYFQVGKRNIECAQNFLAQQGYKDGLADLGGNQGRKILFNSQNGECKLLKLAVMNS